MKIKRMKQHKYKSYHAQEVQLDPNIVWFFLKFPVYCSSITFPLGH